MDKKGNTAEVTVIIISFILLVIAFSLGSKVLTDVDNNYPVGSSAKNTTNIFFKDIQLYSNMFPIIGLIIVGIIIYFVYTMFK